MKPLKPRILVIRLGAMGDVLLVTPALRALKARFPEAHIDVLIKTVFSPLIEHHPAVDGMIRLPAHGSLRQMIHTVREQQYTHVADLQTNLRSFCVMALSGAGKKIRFRHQRLQRWLLLRWRKDVYSSIQPVALRFLSALKPWGIKDDGSGLDLFFNDQTRDQAEQWLRDRNIISSSNLIGLAPGASRMTKRWPETHFMEVARHWADQGCTVIIFGGPEDESLAAEVAAAAGGNGFSAAGSLTRLETAALLEKMSVLLSNDTGLMHMACALKVPVVSLFGPTTQHFGFYPFRAVSHVLEQSMKCRPCSKHGSERCPEGHFQCMLSIDPQKAIDAMTKLLK